MIEGYRGNNRIKASNVPIEWTKELIEEYIRCRDDIIYFVEKYFKIITEDGLVPIVLRPFQKEFLLSMQQNRFTIAVCGRQQGKTETVRAFIVWYVLFHSEKTIAVLANKEATAREILKKIQTSYQSLPLWLQVGVVEWNKTSVELENGSRVLVSSTTSDAVRGFTVHVALVDEAAHIPDADNFFVSVIPTISAGKQTKLILVSTPNGVNNVFHKTWKDSELGRNEFIRIKATWRDVPGRDEEWKQRHLALVNNDTDKFSQEYEAEFIGSSGTLIAGWKLKSMCDDLPIFDRLNVKQYIEPIPNHIYMAIADVSRGKGLDYSTLQVLDITSMPYQQVCVYRSNLTLPSDFSEIINRIGKAYNNAHLLIEINDIGQQVAEILHNDYEYENLINTENKGRLGKRILSTFGVNPTTERGIRTTKTVKNVGCSILKLLIEQNQLLIKDRDTINEFHSFIKVKNSYAAEKGTHDDLVMPLVLFGYVSDQPFFKEITDINTLFKIKELQEKEIQEQSGPLAYFYNGQEKEVVKRGNDLWTVNEYPY